MSEAAESLLDALSALLHVLQGAAAPEDTIERLGGWHRVAGELPDVLDDPSSVVLVRIVARDAASGGDEAIEALPAVVEAVLAMESPAGFADSVEALLASPSVLDVAGDRLAAGLLAQVTPIVELDDTSFPAVSRAATALEAATRLGVGGYGSKFALLAALERFRAPVPKRLAAAVVRSVATVVDHWPDAATLRQVVEFVAGRSAPTGGQLASGDPEDVASDASWVLANIELIEALRADTEAGMLGHLDQSVGYLALGVQAYGRDDAKVLSPVVQAVVSLTRAVPGVTALDAALVAIDDLEQLVERQAQFNITLSGLDHWYTDVKRQATAAWVKLAEDLVRAREQLAQEAFYRPEVAIDDLLQVYRASRSVKVVRRIEDFGGVLGVVQPTIEAGFASNTAFVANLSVYVGELAKSIDTVEDDERAALLEQHDVATQVLEQARAVLARSESPGKGVSGTAIAPLPRQLDELFGADPDAVAKLAELGQDNLARLAGAVENTAAVRHPSLQEDRVLKDVADALTASPDYKGEVKAAVDALTLQMVRFVGSRQNAQESRKPYLFDANANEDKLHEDLYDYLWSAFGASVDIEVPQVGGGRADLRLKFSGFSIYLELKADATRKPLATKGAYLNQAVTYQATDVRIGFLVALRLKAFPQAGAHAHLTSLFTHATVDVQGDSDPRHLILVDVPGNRSSPAEKQSKA